MHKKDPHNINTIIVGVSSIKTHNKITAQFSVFTVLFTHSRVSCHYMK